MLCLRALCRSSTVSRGPPRRSTLARRRVTSVCSLNTSAMSSLIACAHTRPTWQAGLGLDEAPIQGCQCACRCVCAQSSDWTELSKKLHKQRATGQAEPGARRRGLDRCCCPNAGALATARRVTRPRGKGGGRHPLRHRLRGAICTQLALPARYRLRQHLHFQLAALAKGRDALCLTQPAHLVAHCGLLPGN